MFPWRVSGWKVWVCCPACLFLVLHAIDEVCRRDSREAPRARSQAAVQVQFPTLSLTCATPSALPPIPAALLTYAGMGYALTASVAFPALSLFNLLRFPIMMLPQQASTG